MAGNSGPCVSCGKVTEYACADCKIDTRKTVYVCESPVCRDKHESVNCARVPRERIPPMSYDASSDYCPLCGAHPMEQGEGRAIDPLPQHWVKKIHELRIHSITDRTTWINNWLNNHIQEIEDVDGRNLLLALRPDLARMLGDFMNEIGEEDSHIAGRLKGSYRPDR